MTVGPGRMLRYNSEELHSLREQVLHNSSLRKLEQRTGALVRECRPNRKSKRGEKGGRKTNLKNARSRAVSHNNLIRMNTQHCENNDTEFTFLLENDQSIKARSRF